MEAGSWKLEAGGGTGAPNPPLAPSSQLLAPNSSSQLQAPSVSSDSTASFDVLLEAALQVARSRRWRYLEWRGGTCPPPDATPSTTVWSHTVDLTADEPELLQRLEGSTRRALRKAEKSGVTIRFATDAQAMVEYYRLHCLTRRKHGLPPQPYRFFKKIHEHLIAKGQGFVALAERGVGRQQSAVSSQESGDKDVGAGSWKLEAGREACAPDRSLTPSSQLLAPDAAPLSPNSNLLSPASRRAGAAIAGAVFLRLGLSALYKFGASDERFQELRPNNLLMWRSLLHCRELGCTSVHLGRTNLGQEGLRRFKLGWGAREERIDYYRFDLRRGAYVREAALNEGWHNRVFGCLPLSTNRLAGAILYPHLD